MIDAHVYMRDEDMRPFLARPADLLLFTNGSTLQIVDISQGAGQHLICVYLSVVLGGKNADALKSKRLVVICGVLRRMRAGI